MIYSDIFEVYDTQAVHNASNVNLWKNISWKKNLVCVFYA